MTTTDIISIIAIIVSLITAIITIYLQFFYKKEGVYINLANVEGQSKAEIKILFVIHNRGNQNASITNCVLSFIDEEKKSISSGYTMGFSPIILNGNEQKIIEISNFVPDLEPNVTNKLWLNISTTYINSKGYLYVDRTNVGIIKTRNQIMLDQSMIYTPYKLKGTKQIFHS